jgi:hypothetical protein
VFTWTNLLVVVAELDGNESEALDLVPLVTNTVLEEHHLVVGVVDPGVDRLQKLQQKSSSANQTLDRKHAEMRKTYADLEKCEA